MALPSCALVGCPAYLGRERFCVGYRFLYLYAVLEAKKCLSVELELRDHDYTSVALRGTENMFVVWSWNCDY